MKKKYMENNSAGNIKSELTTASVETGADSTVGEIKKRKEINQAIKEKTQKLSNLENAGEMTFNARRVENKKLSNEIREIKKKASPPTKLGKIIGKLMSTAFFIYAYYESHKECERQSKALKAGDEKK